MLIQVGLIYWATGVRKSGELWASGDAVFYALHLHEWVTPLGVYLRDYPRLLEPLSHATLNLERFGPFLAFVPVYSAAFRLATVAIFWGFHAGLAATMNIGLFPLFSMVAWLPWIPTRAWTWIGVATVTTEQTQRSWRARLPSIAAVVCLAYVITLLAERARIIPRVLPPALISAGTALRIQQTWNMFAPDPPRETRRYEIRKTMLDGSSVTEPAATSFRWTVYLDRVGVPSPSGSPLAQSLLRFAHYRCGHGGPDEARAVERIAIVMYHYEIHDDGLSEPLVRTLVDTPCPGG